MYLILSDKQSCIYLKKKTQTYKAEFWTGITPGFSVTLSFTNHYNMLIWCSKIIAYY